MQIQYDVVRLVRQIDQLKGKHIKETLVLLEKLSGDEKLDPRSRKVILDQFNDFTRSIYVAIGYSVES